MNIKQYFKGALLLFVVLTGALCALRFGVWTHLPTWLVFSPLGLLALFTSAFAWLAKTEAQRPQRFVSAFMGALGLKMTVALGVVGAYVYLDGAHSIYVSLLILACYAVYMVHFTHMASKQLRAQPTK